MSAVRIGVDLGGTKISAIALADDGAALFHAQASTPPEYGAALGAIARLVAAARQAAPDAARPVGLGMPGALDPQGLVKNANSTWLIGRPIERDLAAALDAPVRAANDANCLLASELADGAAKGADAAFGVILGTGVGGAAALGGRVVDGANGLAGEWGHAPFPNRAGDRAFERCYCGRLGCVETVLSGPAFTRAHRARAGVERRPSDIAAAAEAGDAAAAASLRAYVDDLAAALAPALAVFDPEVVVVGGGVSRLAALYPALPERLAAHLFHAGATPLRLATRVVMSAHGADSGVRGAARLWAVSEREREHERERERRAGP